MLSKLKLSPWYNTKKYQKIMEGNVAQQILRKTARDNLRN